MTSKQLVTKYSATTNGTRRHCFLLTADIDAQHVYETRIENAEFLKDNTASAYFYFFRESAPENTADYDAADEYPELTKPTRAELESIINADPEHGYTYSPEGTAADRRYVYNSKTFSGTNAAMQAAAYSLSNAAKRPHN